MPSLSVIIPTHERPRELRECLRSLQGQSVPPRDVEIIVVDDGPMAGSVEVATGEVSDPIPMRSVQTGGVGLNAARNRGIEEAQAGLFAFLDDDTIVSSGWAQAVIECFATHDCEGLGGRVELLLETSPPPWLDGRRSYLAEFELGPEGRWLDEGPVPVGANCALSRKAVERVGPFRAGLDRSGSSLVSNGETELFRRLRAAGGRLRYEPSAHVRHRIPPERLTLTYFRRRAYAQGVSDELLIELEGAPPAWRRWPRELIRCGRAGPILARGVLEGNGSTSARLWLRYCRGRLAVLSDSP